MSVIRIYRREEAQFPQTWMRTSDTATITCSLIEPGSSMEKQRQIEVELRRRDFANFSDFVPSHKDV